MKNKKLFLIRHAKAEGYSFSQKDYNRVLIEVGINRAQERASQIKSHIDINSSTLILSSSAPRAIQTATIFCEIWNYPLADIIQNKNIYEAYLMDILNEINQVADTVNTLVVFGHNPGLSNLANYICNTYISLSTSSAAEIILEEGLNFAELSENTATLKQVFGE